MAGKDSKPAHGSEVSSRKLLKKIATDTFEDVPLDTDDFIPDGEDPDDWQEVSKYKVDPSKDEAVDSPEKCIVEEPVEDDWTYISEVPVAEEKRKERRLSPFSLRERLKDWVPTPRTTEPRPSTPAPWQTSTGSFLEKTKPAGAREARKADDEVRVDGLVVERGRRRNPVPNRQRALRHLLGPPPRNGGTSRPWEG